MLVVLFCRLTPYIRPDLACLHLSYKLDYILETEVGRHLILDHPLSVDSDVSDRGQIVSIDRQEAEYAANECGVFLGWIEEEYSRLVG